MRATMVQRMADSLWTLTLSEFRARTASARPTPGGGSVCAVSASLGLGLVIMALEITQKRAHEPQLEELIGGGRTLLDDLGLAADEDARVFDEYMRAHELPQRTEAESSCRAEALRRAATEASEVPIRAADCAVRALELACAAAERASTHVISDVVAGAELLQAAMLGLFATLAMNLKAVDPAVRARILHTRDGLTRRGEDALAQVRSTSQQRAGAGVAPG